MIDGAHADYESNWVVVIVRSGADLHCPLGPQPPPQPRPPPHQHLLPSYLAQLTQRDPNIGKKRTWCWGWSAGQFLTIILGRHPKY